jgi:hypothetical protein
MTDRMTISLKPGLADTIKGVAQLQERSASAVCADLLALGLAAKGVKMPESADPWATVKVTEDA